ncbi:MAG: glycosyltransferase family A protein [Lachnospiraceae bacterium]|nr:glycosyltransferase family A protein [Lachnospiraceae bacterium]
MNKVSIVVPVYNMGDKIEICVQSLLNQTYENLEVILVDDGSKDDSFAHCQKLETQDNRVIAYHTENRGSGPARNYGIEHATGMYIYFPDADDYLEPNAIEVLEKTMREKKVDLVVFGFKKVNSNGELKKTKKYPNMVCKGNDIRNDYSDYMTIDSKYGIQGAPWNKFFDLSVIKGSSIIYPPLRRHQDEGFISRYMTVARTVCFIDEVFYTYFTNDLSKEWDKYPVDYIDAVNGLYRERKQNILEWNYNDSKVHDMVYKEYICGFIKALELSFSPKYGLNKKSRKNWIETRVKESEINSICEPVNLGNYQKVVLRMIKNNNPFLYMILSFKVFVEKNGLLGYIKR